MRQLNTQLQRYKLSYRDMRNMLMRRWLRLERKRNCRYNRHPIDTGASWKSGMRGC